MKKSTEPSREAMQDAMQIVMDFASKLEDEKPNKNYVFPSGMLITSAVAKNLIPIEPLSDGAKIYYHDGDLNMCPGIGPDDFGGTDDGSHYMSQTSFTPVATRDIKKGETVQLCSTLETGEITHLDLSAPVDPHAWIQLYSGRKFFPMAPKVDDIDIEDIAHALSNQCRFSGHVRNFYSVAQHSLFISYLVGSDFALWGLLHDASETYLIDMPKPIKRLKEFEIFSQIEKNIQSVICQKFGLSATEPPIVKEMDIKMLATEARDLMSPLHPEWHQPCEPFPFTIEPFGPRKAKRLFLARYRELMEKNG